MKTNKSLDRDITRKFSFNFPIVHLIRTILQPEIFFYHFNAHRKHLPIYTLQRHFCPPFFHNPLYFSHFLSSTKIHYSQFYFARKSINIL